MTLEICCVKNRQQKRDFIRVPWLLHKRDPNWVPPLKLSVQNLLNTHKHPFYKQAELKLWVAYRDKKPVGRIAGILNHAHNQFHNEKVAFWGFFESDNNLEISKALFSVVEQWALQSGICIMRGPANPSTNYECGLQINAFDTKPFIMMTQNPAYYPRLLESLDYSKIKDLYAWMLSRKNDSIDTLMARIKHFESIALVPSDKNNIKIRPINRRCYQEEVDRILAIYNESWEKNWGFSPMSPAELNLMSREMKAVLIPESAWIVEVKGETAAFGVFLPDINQILVKIRNGKLFPKGLGLLLWHLKIKKTVTQGRIPLLGVRKKFRHLNLGALLYANYARVLLTKGYHSVECSWILEDNHAMSAGLRIMGAEQYKTYRIYEKVLP